jgi:hypothetical protein
VDILNYLRANLSTRLLRQQKGLLLYQRKQLHPFSTPEGVAIAKDRN